MLSRSENVSEAAATDDDDAAAAALRTERAELGKVSSIAVVALAGCLRERWRLRVRGLSRRSRCGSRLTNPGGGAKEEKLQRLPQSASTRGGGMRGDVLKIDITL